MAKIAKEKAEIKIAPNQKPEKKKRKYTKKKSLQVSNNSLVAVDSQLIILKAIEKDLDLDKMERLLVMRRELNKESEKRLYFSNLAKFQSECPVIGKKEKVLNKDQKSTRYVYAPIEDMIEPIKPYLEKYGFSYHFETVLEIDKEKKTIWVETICITTHEAGHEEKTKFKAPVDMVAYMTAPQKIASASTFTQRYALKNALGLIMRGEDDDANTSEDPKPQKPKTETKKNQPKKKVVNQKPNESGESFKGTDNITNISDYIPEPKDLEKIRKEIIQLISSKKADGKNVFSSEEMIKYKRAGVSFLDEGKLQDALNVVEIVTEIKEQRTGKKEKNSE